MRKPFKKGDMITRIKGGLKHSVTIGKSYIVLENEDNRAVYIRNNYGVKSPYEGDYFELSKHNIVKQIINDL